MPDINFSKNREIETQRGLVDLNPSTPDFKAYGVLCHVDLDKMDTQERMNKGTIRHK